MKVPYSVDNRVGTSPKSQCGNAQFSSVGTTVGSTSYKGKVKQVKKELKTKREKKKVIYNFYKVNL